MFSVIFWETLNDMKKYLLAIFFCLMAVAGFSQISKNDAAGFLTRNPIANCDRFVVYNGVGLENDRVYDTKFDFQKADIVSMTAMDSGFSVLVNQNGVKREKFYPYASIRYMNISSDNSFVLVMLR